eukprot:TRINITY_DN93243_c0_g1_i1.p1 TRINITY_DN93243_c0_g1~~TRINITY_DN93243_c0_g1_i1.p1  ORF type:complete len:427 (+),score=111.67 TRINITY_DN93243_c0_g1_i1:77-1282(+)
MGWQPFFAGLAAVLLSNCVDAAVLRGVRGSAGGESSNGTAALAGVRVHRGLRSGVPEQIEQWRDSGKAAQCRLAEEKIAAAAAALTADAYSAQLHAIVDSQASRFIANSGNGRSADVVAKMMSGLGLETQLQKLDGSSVMHYLAAQGVRSLNGNVIGFLKGTDLAHEVVIVGCHYDSVNWEDVHAAAPGVDDNGSGTALMLLLAKALGQMRPDLRRSVLFVAFNAEEEGLVGSKQFAQKFKVGGEFRQRYGVPVAALVADEVAWPGVGGSDRRVIFETKGRTAANAMVVDTLAHAAAAPSAGNVTNITGQASHKNVDGVDGFVVNYAGFGSDHIPLLDVGIPAVLLIEKDNMHHADTWGHSSRDTFEHISADFGAALTRLAFRAVVALAAPQDAASAAAAR